MAAVEAIRLMNGVERSLTFEHVVVMVLPSSSRSPLVRLSKPFVLIQSFRSQPAGRVTWSKPLGVS